MNDPANGEFQHTYFLEGRRDLLPLIKRKAHMKSMGTTGGASATGAFPAEPKPSRSQGGSSKKANASADYSLSSGPVLALPSLSTLGAQEASLISESDGVLSEFVNHKVLKNDVERRMRQLERQSARIAELESKQSVLLSENSLLNQVVQDVRKKQLRMQEKMDKIMLMLYSVFTSAPIAKMMSGENWVLKKSD